MDKDEIYYIVDNTNDIYFYSYHGLMSSLLCDFAFKYYCKKYPNKKLYKIKANLLCILEKFNIDKDFWEESEFV